MPQNPTFDFIAQLAEPIGAAVTALCLVALFSIGSYFLISRAKAKTGKTNSFALLAEILTAVGLLGLATFVGRAKLDSNEFQRAVGVTRAEARLYSLVQGFVKYDCGIAPQRSPTKFNAKMESVCDFAQEYEKHRNPDIDWYRIWADLDALSNQLINTDTAAYERAKSLSIAASEISSARSKFNRDKAEKYFLTYNPPWLFIAVCFLVSTLGVSLKCARAFVEHKANC